MHTMCTRCIQCYTLGSARKRRSLLTTHERAQGLDLLQKMLRYPPHERISAMDALQHPYFEDLRAYQPGTRLPIGAQYQ